MTEDCIKMLRPLFGQENECHTHLRIYYPNPNWSQFFAVIRPVPPINNDEEARNAQFEGIASEFSKSSYGVCFLCAVNTCSGSWIARPMMYKNSFCFDDYYCGRKNMEEVLIRLVCSKVNFDDVNRLLCIKSFVM